MFILRVLFALSLTFFLGHKGIEIVATMDCQLEAQKQGMRAIADGLIPSDRRDGALFIKSFRCRSLSYRLIRNNEKNSEAITKTLYHPRRPHHFTFQEKL